MIRQRRHMNEKKDCNLKNMTRKTIHRFALHSTITSPSALQYYTWPKMSMTGRQNCRPVVKNCSPVSPNFSHWAALKFCTALQNFTKVSGYT